jgi:uncharacterized protein (TIGR03435 family)
VLTPEFASSFGRLTANHLWQSTAFAAVAVLLALALRANHARARYWLWLAASAKFLVPFSALAAIGAALGRWFIPAPPAPRFPFVMEQIVQPFTPMPYPSLPAAPSAPPAASLLPALLLSLWLCGFLAVLLYEWTRYRRVAAAVRSATPLTNGRELEAWRFVCNKVERRRSWWGGPPGLPSVVSSTANLEPGAFGIFRPVLWLPAGIAHRLEDAELEAILAHELCHIRRRDNLLATLHLLVESIFWFHPLVWWLGARLEEERERACDEEVVRLGGEPQIYAESILKVVEFYLASPVACAAGVTGGELKRRIEGIMANRFTRELNLGRKLLLAVVAMVAVAGPIAIGFTNLSAQGGSPQVKFEVASVRPHDPAQFAQLAQIDQAQARFWGHPLIQLVMEAYGLKVYQVRAPDWMIRQAYDVVAKLPPGADKKQVPEMLQALLAERFGLRVHWESVDQRVYLLTAGRSGVKLTESASVGAEAHITVAMDGSGIHGRNATLADIAGALTRCLDRPVIDQTGNATRYDIDLNATRYDIDLDLDKAESAPSSEAGMAAAAAGKADMQGTLLSALRKVGIELNLAPHSVRRLVVDSANKSPTEN